MSRVFVGVFCVLALAGCPADTDGDDPLCEDAPYVDYETWGAGFITGNCQSCHASTAADRQDAPESVIFDTWDDVHERRFAILNAATGERPYMPPAGGVSEDDRYLLEVWITCWDAR